MRRALKHLLVAALLLSSSARADTEACARTLHRARELRDAGKLHDALHVMEACNACDALADVCASTKAALQSSAPTLTVTVHDCDGVALDDARVSIDGAPVAQGEETELDPGAHTVRAELGGRTEEQTVLVLEGEKRRASLMIRNPARARPLPVSVILSGATAAFSLAASATLWAWAATPLPPVSASPTNIYIRSNEAAPAQGTHDALVIAASAALAVGLTALVATVVLYATRPFHTAKRPN